MRAPLAGAIAGVAALAIFLTIHAFWIVPIWMIAPAGVVVAAAGGAAVGWAFETHHARWPRAASARVAAVAIAGAVVLAPAEPIALARGPVDVRVLAQMQITEAWPTLVVFFALATLVGGLMGWAFGRTERAAGVTALAAFLFALGIGHNAPFIGYGYLALKMWAIMLAATIAAAITLVALDRSVQGGGT